MPSLDNAMDALVSHCHLSWKPQASASPWLKSFSALSYQGALEKAKASAPLYAAGGSARSLLIERLFKKHEHLIDAAPLSLFEISSFHSNRRGACEPLGLLELQRWV
jgi:hypothetical protein